ncbi:hypothetical protein GF340_05425 [Candidatus Peregrinibacteria bacterium]|nr:hypothetical protein [Candidatus Peregrinibacteria bacterium]
MTKSTKTIHILIKLLSLVAIFVTAYLLYMHFKPELSDYCSFGDNFDCDVVNKSPWSVIDLGFMRIPVALLGLLTYTIFFIASWLLKSGKDLSKIFFKWTTNKLLVIKMTVLSVIGVAFSLYLTYIEAFVLQTYCIFCVTQQVIIFIIMILYFVLLGRYLKEKE